MVKMNDTPTPRTDALMPTQENGRTLYDHAQIMEIHARQLERELADMTKQRDHYKAACDQYSEDEMLCKLQEVTKQRDALAEALREMLKFTPHSLVCQDFHHPTKDCHSESEDCQPTKRFRDALAKAEQALAATKK
jgi:hypothetical protein